MKDLVKILVFALAVLAIAPLAGFWIVALVGAGLLLLPFAAILSEMFGWEKYFHKTGTALPA